MKSALGQDLIIGDIVSSTKRVNGVVEVMIGSVTNVFPDEGKVQVDIFKRGSSLYEASITVDESPSLGKRKLISNSLYKINIDDVNW